VGLEKRKDEDVSLGGKKSKTGRLSKPSCRGRGGVGGEDVYLKRFSQKGASCRPRRRVHSALIGVSVAARSLYFVGEGSLEQGIKKEGSVTISSGRPDAPSTSRSLVEEDRFMTW